jgi:chaperonin GroEL (HSP60 family)
MRYKSSCGVGALRALEPDVEHCVLPGACREHARSIPGKSQVFVNAYARALEVIPRQLCDNAGFDATDVLSRLRNKHAQSEDRGKQFGIDISTGGHNVSA